MFFKLIKLFDCFRKKQFFVISIAILQYSILTYLTFLFKDLLDSVQKNELNLFVLMAIRIILLSIVVVLLGSATDYYWKKLTYNSIAFLRSKIFTAILNKGNQYFKNNSIGNILTSIMDDVVIVAQTGSIAMPMLVINSFRIIIVLIAMSMLNIKLALTVAATSLTYFVIFNVTNGKIRAASKLERKEYSNVFSDVQEKISAIELIKIHSKENFISTNFEILCKNHFNKLKKLFFITSVGKGINNFIVVIFPIFILATGSYIVLKNQMTVGSVIAFYGLVTYIVEPINNLSDFNLGLQTTLGMSDRVMSILEDEVQIVNGNDIDLITNVEFKNVNFSYNKDKEILRNFNAKFYEKDKIAIIGRSGMGKSTLLNLLIRFIEPTSGEITINNIDLNDINLKSYYKNISYLQQFPFLLKASIEENITFGDEYSKEQITESINVSCLEQFISELPKGFNTDISEVGGNISGGEKQRICLARELIRKPSIIILDEPTSSLDDETERILTKSIDEYLSVNRSITFIVSHRKEILKICNKVISFTDDGVNVFDLKDESDLRKFQSLNTGN